MSQCTYFSIRGVAFESEFNNFSVNYFLGLFTGHGNIKPLHSGERTAASENGWALDTKYALFYRIRSLMF